MQETFYEESSVTQDLKGNKAKYIIFKVISISSLVMGIFFTIMLFIAGSVFELIFSIVLAAMSYFIFFFLGRKKDAFFLDFDYTFISGNLRISKVFNNKRRKNIANFNTTDIITLGRVDSQTYERLVKDPQNKLMIATPNQEAGENKGFYYIHFNQSGNKKVMVLECTEFFMYTVLKHSSKTVLEQDFK